MDVPLLLYKQLKIITKWTINYRHNNGDSQYNWLNYLQLFGRTRTHVKWVYKTRFRFVWNSKHYHFFLQRSFLDIIISFEESFPRMLWRNGNIFFKWTGKNWNQKERNYIAMNQSIPAVFIPLRAFFDIVSPRGQALVYLRAFDGFVLFIVQHRHCLSMTKFIGKHNKFVLYNVHRGQNEQSKEQYWEIRLIWGWLELTFIRMKICPKMEKSSYFLTVMWGIWRKGSFDSVWGICWFVLKKSLGAGGLALLELNDG